MGNRGIDDGGDVGLHHLADIDPDRGAHETKAGMR